MPSSGWSSWAWRARTRQPTTRAARRGSSSRYSFSRQLVLKAFSLSMPAHRRRRRRRRRRYSVVIEKEKRNTRKRLRAYPARRPRPVGRRGSGAPARGC